MTGFYGDPNKLFPGALGEGRCWGKGLVRKLLTKVKDDGTALPYLDFSVKEYIFH